MVLSKKKDIIDHKYLYKKLTDYDIYRYYVGEFTVGNAFKNPFRRDKRASMSIYGCEDGKLRHTDYADDLYEGDGVDLVMQVYGLKSPAEAVKKIAQDFGLTTGTNDYQRITSQYKQPVVEAVKHCLIQVTTKKFTKADIAWWAKYLITPEMLKADEVYSVKEFYVNRRKVVIGKDELVYAYHYPEGFKIYMPQRYKEEKWRSSISTKTVENTKVIADNKQILITKAKKDRLCLSQLVPGVINVQNETRSCFTEAFVNTLDDKKVLINFDADEPGKKNSRRLTEEYPKFKHLNVPDNLLQEGIKDFSDWIAARGNTKEVEEFLSKKGII